MQVSRQPLNISPDLAQRTADIIQKPVELVIEKKNKTQEPAGNGDNNTEKRRISPESFIRIKTLKVELNAA